MQFLCAYLNEVIRPYQEIAISEDLLESLNQLSYHPKAFIKRILIPKDKLLTNLCELEILLLKGHFSDRWPEIYPLLLHKIIKKHVPKHLRAFCVFELFFFQFCARVHEHIQNVKVGLLVQMNFYYCPKKLLYEISLNLYFMSRFIRFLCVFKTVSPPQWKFPHTTLYYNIFWNTLKILCAWFSILDREDNKNSISILLSQMATFEHYNEQFTAQTAGCSQFPRIPSVFNEVNLTFIPIMFRHIRILLKLSSGSSRKRLQVMSRLYKILSTPIKKKYPGFNFLKAYLAVLLRRIFLQYKKSKIRSFKTYSFTRFQQITLSNRFLV